MRHTAFIAFFGCKDAKLGGALSEEVSDADGTDASCSTVPHLHNLSIPQVRYSTIESRGHVWHWKKLPNQKVVRTLRVRFFMHRTRSVRTTFWAPFESLIPLTSYPSYAAEAHGPREGDICDSVSNLPVVHEATVSRKIRKMAVGQTAGRASGLLARRRMAGRYCQRVAALCSKTVI
jgi:hypothetical protein